MARLKRTSDYLNQLQLAGYPRYDYFDALYQEWRNSSDLAPFTQFQEDLWEEKDNMKPEFIGENTYSNLRGISFEEFCFTTIGRIIENSSRIPEIKLFWNERILTEEFLLFKDNHFSKHPKYKRVDLAIGMKQTNIIHPFSIMSCKVWQSTNWLDEDRAILDSIRVRYPAVIGYSLCMSLNVPKVSLISAQRTGLQVYDFSIDGQYDEFVSDVRKSLQEIVGW